MALRHFDSRVISCNLYWNLPEIIWLVVWNIFHISISWECHHPFDELIFFRGVGIQPPTSRCIVDIQKYVKVFQLPIRTQQVDLLYSRGGTRGPTVASESRTRRPPGWQMARWPGRSQVLRFDVCFCQE